MAVNDIYHERQSLQLCALHMLNNLFQSRDMFTKADLDQICVQLNPRSWRNPHRSMLGLGNYDINVIMSALQGRGFEAQWFDKRRLLASIVLENVFGFILNVPGNYKVLNLVSLPFEQKHWIALKKIQGRDAWYNLDSTLKGPERIGTDEEFLAYLQNELQSADKELIIVVSNAVALNQSWKRELPEQIPSAP